MVFLTSGKSLIYFCWTVLMFWFQNIVIPCKNSYLVDPSLLILLWWPGSTEELQIPSRLFGTSPKDICSATWQVKSNWEIQGNELELLLLWATLWQSFHLHLIYFIRYCGSHFFFYFTLLNFYFSFSEIFQNKKKNLPSVCSKEKL